MIRFAALATNTVYGYFGFAVAARALDVLHGGYRHVHTLDPPETGEIPTLVTTDRPRAALARALIASQAPILAFFDAPENLAAQALYCDGESFAASLRRASHDIACLSGCAQAPGLRVFDASWRRAELREFVAGVLAALGASGAQGDEVCERVSAGEGLAGSPTVAEVLRRRLGGEALAVRAKALSAQERDLLRAFAAGYGPFLQGRVAALEWPPGLFVSEAGEGGAVAMIGPPRHLVWGPYLHLPAGRWRANVEFEVEGNASGNVVEADVSELTKRGQLARGLAFLPERGRFRFGLEFDNPSPDAPLEIRVRMRESAIEGRFWLRRVTLTPGAAAI